MLKTQMYKTVVWMVVLNSFWVAESAWSVSPMQALKQQLARATQFKTYEGEFIQTVVYPNHHKKETSSGHFYLKKPRQLRWEVRQPYPTVMITNGVQVYHYDPRLQQVKIRPFKTNQPVLQALVLSQIDTPRLSGYRVTRGSEPGVFRLDAQRSSLPIKRMMIVFRNQALVWVNALDTSGYQFTLQFKPLKYNHPLSPRLFQWSAPSRTENGL